MIDLPSRIAAGVAAVSFVAAVAFPVQADTPAAEKQLRLARRLAVTDTAEAKAAFDRALELDPDGPWADDALLESVLLDGPPATPAALGGIDEARRDAWLARLSRVSATADRGREARRWASVLHLVPQPGRDARAARRGFLELTSDPVDDTDAAQARTWLGWVDSIEGRGAAAADAWTRVVADARDPEASRAACGHLADWFLRAERPRDALGWNERARGLGGGDDDFARLAWRQWQRIDGRPEGFRGSTAERLVDGLRGDLSIGRGAGNDRWIARFRDGVVERRRGDDPAATWSVTRLSAFAVDPYGRGFAASDREVFSLVDGGRVRLAEVGGFGAPRALAIDRNGVVWAIDRRGSKLARLTGAGVLEVVHEDRSARWIDLEAALDGPVAVDGKTGRLQRFDRDGRPSVGIDAPGRPVALALDAADWTYALDARAKRVEVRSSQGALREQIDLTSLGIVRPEALAVDPDGGLVVYDADGGVVKRFP